MSLDQVEHDVGCIARQRDHPAAEVGAKIGLHSIGVMFQARIDLTTVSAGSPPAGFVRLQQRDLHAHFGQMQSSRQTGESATDDGDVCASIPAQWRRIRRWHSGIGVEAGWQGDGGEHRPAFNSAVWNLARPCSITSPDL